MESKDLRLGNLVQFPSGAQYTVDVLYKNYAMLEFWRPIPITKELLIQLGFEKNSNDYAVKIQKDDKLGNTDYWISLDLGIDNQTNKITVQILSQEGCYYTTKHQYVHELQNLYFALTGEELTLKQ